jgi:hypothetical protein
MITSYVYFLIWILYDSYTIIKDKNANVFPQFIVVQLPSKKL